MKNGIYFKIINLGSHTSTHGAKHHQSSNKVAVNRAFTICKGNDVYGRGYINFSPNDDLNYQEAIPSGRILYGMVNYDKYKKCNYLSVYRYSMVEEPNELYFILSLKTDKKLHAEHIFTNPSSKSFIISYAGWDNHNVETILLLKKGDLVLLDRKYYEVDNRGNLTLKLKRISP